MGCGAYGSSRYATWSSVRVTALVLSEKTVSVHVSNMLRKTGTANRVELTQLAHRLEEGTR